MADSKLIDMISDLVKAIQEENREQNKTISGIAVQVGKLEAFKESIVETFQKVFKKLVLINSEIKEIKKVMPNERELARAEKENDTIKTKVEKNSNSLLKIFLYVAGTMTAIGFIVSVLKWAGKI